MAAFLAMNMMNLPTISQTVGGHKITDQSQSRSIALLPLSSAEPLSRRKVVSCLVLSWVLRPFPAPAAGGEEANSEEGKDEEGVIGAIKSIFDPNEKAKTGKVLPKAYLKSAREVVKTLKESLSQEDPKNIVQFRRNADSAKESIRDYLNNWRGQKTVVNEESYIMLEKAIRSLAGFYSKAGPSATLPEQIKTEILDELSKVEEYL